MPNTLLGMEGKDETNSSHRDACGPLCDHPARGRARDALNSDPAAVGKADCPRTQGDFLRTAFGSRPGSPVARRGSFLMVAPTSISEGLMVAILRYSRRLR